MAGIICLANSRKHGNSCIAGIKQVTGKWIRPISTLPDGAITPAMRLIRGAEPELLDILEIPLQESGPDYGFQPENRSLATGAWQKAGQAKPDDVLEHCSLTQFILHNKHDCVPWRELQKFPKELRESLQLVHCGQVKFYATKSSRGNTQCRAKFQRGWGLIYDLVVTDPIIEEKVKKVNLMCLDCIMTISLGMPFPENSRNQKCYKLVAGVIELSEM
ncbi:MAG: hypothetical protein KAV00_00260 [Phycisphaerae bacterium]|nr:hypothetical protein [Phycisphaerae bacterium]